MTPPIPEESFVAANGLKHHVLTWAPKAAPRGTVLLAHGFLDHAWSWQPVAARLVHAGYRAIAWSWRGHGETEHIGAGGYYHFPDYVADLFDLLPQLRSEGPLHLVAHSMGGTIASMYTGLAGDGPLKSLTLVEGLGPPKFPVDRTPDKFQSWLRDRERHRERLGRPPKPMTIEGALQRMRVQTPKLPEALGLFLAEKATKEIPGGRAWRFDPLHRTTSPMPFLKESFVAFLKRIEVPTLVVAGEKGFRLPDENERMVQLKDHRFVEIPDVGHMIHLLAVEELCAAVLAHIDD